MPLNPDDIRNLVDTVNEELRGSLALRARIDEEIKKLRGQRIAVDEQINNARAMLKFAEIATKSDTSPRPLPPESGGGSIPVPPDDPTPSGPTRDAPPL